jgi:hypothetical protein
VDGDGIDDGNNDDDDADDDAHRGTAQLLSALKGACIT